MFLLISCLFGSLLIVIASCQTFVANIAEFYAAGRNKLKRFSFRSQNTVLFFRNRYFLRLKIWLKMGFEAEIDNSERNGVVDNLQEEIICSICCCIFEVFCCFFRERPTPVSLDFYDCMGNLQL